MAFRFKTSLGLQDNLRKVACDQLDAALEALDQGKEAPGPAGIHDARKRIKKLRGLLRLVRPGLGEDFDRENGALREVGHVLAPVRDATMLPAVIDGLAEDAEEHEGAAETLVDLRTWAAARRDRHLEALDPAERRAQAVAGLREIRDRAPGWSIDGKSRKVLRGGLRKTYRRARDGYDAALEDAGAEALHDWRKRVKYHSYHCRILSRAWPEALKARARVATRLETVLGDDHDLTVLAQLLEAETEETGLDPAELRVVQGLIRTRSGLLRQEALRLAPQIFIDSPKALAKRVARYWALASPA